MIKHIDMKIISLKDVEKKEVHMDGAVGAWRQLPLGSDDGTPVYSYRVFTVEPGGHTPYHNHPYEHVNYIIGGRGVIRTESGEERPVSAGDFALVLPDEKHQYRNASEDEPFVMICQPATGDTQYDGLKAEAAGIDNLTFLERVPFHEIDSYFEQAKVLVNTSDSEGFPNTFIQACKASTAILTYTVNPDGFLDEKKCGICCGKDMSILTEHLRQLLANNSFRKLGQHGKYYAYQSHDIKRIINEYKVILKRSSELP